MSRARSTSPRGVEREAGEQPPAASILTIVPEPLEIESLESTIRPIAPRPTFTCLCLVRTCRESRIMTEGEARTRRGSKQRRTRDEQHVVAVSADDLTPASPASAERCDLAMIRGNAGATSSQHFRLILHLACFPSEAKIQPHACRCLGRRRADASGGKAVRGACSGLLAVSASPCVGAVGLAQKGAP
jgi:hypothetical protein